MARQDYSKQAAATTLRRWLLGLLALVVLALTAFAGPMGHALAQLPPLTTTPTPDRRVLNEISSPRSVSLRRRVEMDGAANGLYAASSVSAGKG